MIYSCLLINGPLLALSARRFARAPLSFYAIFELSFHFVLGIGIPFLQLMNDTIGYKFSVDELPLVELQYLLGCIVIIATRWLWLRIEYSPRPAHAPPSEALPASLYVLAGLSAVSLIAFAANAGVSFGTQSYTIRYDNSSGQGLLLLFFPAFLPLTAYLLLQARSRLRFCAVALGALIYSGLTTIVLSGYRQLLIAAVMLVLTIGIVRRIFPPIKTLLGGAIGAMALLIGLSFVRYSGEYSSPFGSTGQAAMYYVQGDLFPIDAIIRTREYCSSNLCPGISVFFQHLLLHFAPRFLWSDKPQFALDAAGFYTRIIVGYPRNVTLSATVAGEGILVAGTVGYTIILCLSVLLTSILDRCSQRTSGFARYVLASQSYLGFFLVREGLEDAVARTIVTFIYIVIGIFAAAILTAAPRSRRTTARMVAQ
jgi:hypothetical protein